MAAVDRLTHPQTPSRPDRPTSFAVAKDHRAELDGKELLLHAAATARRAADLQATSVLVVDPFDAKTAAMWRQRYGFRPSAEPGQSRRLWLPLDASD